MKIQTGHCYIFTDGHVGFRVFAVAPEEDLAIIAPTTAASTRIREASLTSLLEGLQQGLIVPAPEAYRPSVPIAIQSAAAQAAFAKLRPALEALWGIGVFQLARIRLWPRIVEQAGRFGLSPTTLNRAFSAVIAAGGVLEAAIPHWNHCGRSLADRNASDGPGPDPDPEAYALKADDYKNIAAGVRRFLQNGTTWEEAYDRFLGKFYSKGYELIAGRKVPKALPCGQRPSVGQFKRHGMILVPLHERLKLAFGAHAVQTNHRGGMVGQSAPSLYPGFVGEIDWSILDNVAVARGSRLSIGRLVIYVIIDAHCGAVLSAYATMDSGCAMEAGRAILGCLEDKVELCARVGLKIERAQWDMQSLPVELRCDKGEIDSFKSTGLGTALGMRLEFCPARRPDLKGTVESFFRILSFKMRRLRGGTSGARERLKDHPNVTAIYDFDQLQQLIFTVVILYNARVRRRQAMTPGMVADLVRPVPNELYRWAKDRGCMRDFPMDAARIGCLPTHHASVTPQGITIKGLTYEVPEFEPDTVEGIRANDWLMQARAKRWKVEVGIDPSTVDYIWLRHRPAGGKPVELQCPLCARHEGWRQLSWIEYGLNRAEYQQSIRHYEETTLRAVRAWAHHVITGTTKEAKDLTKPKRAGMTKAAQIESAAKRGPLLNPPPREVEHWLQTADEFFPDDQWTSEHNSALT